VAAGDRRRLQAIFTPPGVGHHIFTTRSIRAGCDAGNARSRHLLESIGFSFVERASAS
jgi:RimJ/RimL family protein N-acetyltransferase